MQPRRYCHVQRHSRFTLGVCALVLLGMLIGAFISLVGDVRSHGLAEFAAGQHNVDGLPVDAHGHTHDNDHSNYNNHNSANPAFPEAGADHAHHGADHSHDKSHVPSGATAVALSIADSWSTTARHWVELVEAFRLERPPMA